MHSIKKFNFLIINHILSRINLIFIGLNIFKAFLLFLYFISGYQYFLVISIKLILRIILSNDSALLLVSVLNIISYNIKPRPDSVKIMILLASAASVLFCLFTMAAALFALAVI